MTFIKTTITVAALSFAVLGAHAQSSNATSALTGLYAGVSLNNTKISEPVLGTRTGFDALGGYIGYNITPIFAVEGAVHGLGKINVNGESASAYNVSLVASLPASPEFNIFGRVGYGHVKASGVGTVISVTATGAGLSATGNSALFGVGARYNINQNLAVRAEYTRLASDTGTFGVGLQYGF